MKVGETLYVANRAEWRAWLEKHHTDKTEIFLIYYKKPSGRARIPYNDAVDEAVCFGWIDSIVKAIDTKKYCQRFTPRRKGSPLSPMNLERARRMINEGRMTKAGLATIQDQLEQSSGAITEEPLKIASDIKQALKDGGAWTNYQNFPKSYQRIRIGWIEGARRRPEVFQQRLGYFVRMTALNKQYGMVR